VPVAGVTVPPAAGEAVIVNWYWVWVAVKLAVTVSAALMVTVVEALLALATGPVQPVNW
jgi:hypothetical protein